MTYWKMEYIWGHPAMKLDLFRRHIVMKFLKLRQKKSVILCKMFLKNYLKGFPKFKNVEKKLLFFFLSFSKNSLATITQP